MEAPLRTPLSFGLYPCRHASRGWPLDKARSRSPIRPMNLNRIAHDIDVGGLGIASPSPPGVLGAAWPQPPGTSLHTPSRPAGTVLHRARYENSVFSGFTFDFSKLHFLEPRGEISVQKMIGCILSIGSCIIWAALVSRGGAGNYRALVRPYLVLVGSYL